MYCLDALVVTWKISASQTWISPRAASSTSRPATSTAAARRGRRSPGSTLPSKAMLSRFDRAFRSTKRHRLQLLPWRGRGRVELGHRLGTAGERALRFQKRAAVGVWSLAALTGLRTLQQNRTGVPCSSILNSFAVAVAHFLELHWQDGDIPGHSLPRWPDQDPVQGCGHIRIAGVGARLHRP